MKKVFILGFALLLFSCSQEDTESLNSAESKDVSTIDPLIGYKSPYNEDGYGSQLETGQIEYLFNNETNLTFKITPFFGLGFCDYGNGGVDDLLFRGFDLVDPVSGFDGIHLTANGKKFGNYIASHYSNPITLINSTKSIISTSPQLTVPIPGFSTRANLFDFSQGNPDGVASTSRETMAIAGFGKLFYAEVEVYKNGVLIFETYLKADFPLVNSSSIYSNTGNWRTLYNDSFFGEKMVYNIHTTEICIPNTELSTYLSKETFVYGGKTYKVGIASTTSKVEVYLK
ncbi:hypothetical protein [Myroides odoratus]|uniref:hypothetical protein n=1 Tax=Myroides odoratus TaxID=256 RepID=UPI002167342E|nr:hypothetical protein [Myroides odoratus]MCS4239758.1 hypothetical protein [Myroides odoratus]MDH6601165.1 hypothetical protein [Myroides gitamensis]